MEKCRERKRGEAEDIVATIENVDLSQVSYRRNDLHESRI